VSDAGVVDRPAHATRAVEHVADRDLGRARARGAREDATLDAVEKLDGGERIELEERGVEGRIEHEVEFVAWIECAGDWTKARTWCRLHG
jgi:hypothetical protein